MDDIGRFTGFSRDALRFISQLKKNNNRPWFERHKEDYLRHILGPARAFVADMGPVLGRLYPGIVADPGPSGSIFRIHKDTRFSADKSPYKTHLGIFFWQGPGRKMDRPGFYFELDDRGMRLCYGWYLFPPEILKRYRQIGADDECGEQLVRAVRKVKSNGVLFGGEHYKRLPRGCTLAGPRAELMRHNTLYTELDCGRTKELASAALLGYCARQWKKSRPIWQWVQHLLRPLDSGE